MLAPKVTFRFAVGAARRSTRLARVGPIAFSAQSLTIASSSRGYATPSKPKKGSVGESSIRTRPRKTAQDKAEEVAAKAAAKAARDEVRGAKRNAAAEKKTATEKAKRDKTKLKKKTTATKTKAKPRPKKRVTRPKKELTEEQKARRKVIADRIETKELKATALSAPTRRSLSAWTIFLTERGQNELKGTKGEAADVRDRLAQTTKDAAAAYKSLSSSEREHYNHLANEDKVKREKDYAAFVSAHSPEQIRAANVARSRLRAKQKVRGAWPAIADERQAYRPISSYLAFSSERHKSGDFKAIPFGEVAKLISQEWKALSGSEKQRYIEQQHESQTQYQKDFLTAYGRESTSGKKPAVTDAA